MNQDGLRFTLIILAVNFMGLGEAPQPTLCKTEASNENCFACHLLLNVHQSLQWCMMKTLKKDEDNKIHVVTQDS